MTIFFNILWLIVENELWNENCFINDIGLKSLLQRCTKYMINIRIRVNYCKKIHCKNKQTTKLVWKMYFSAFSKLPTYVFNVDNLIIFICKSKNYIPTIIDWRKSYKNWIMTPCFMWHCSKYLVLNNSIVYMVDIQCIKFLLKLTVQFNMTKSNSFINV